MLAKGSAWAGPLQTAHGPTTKPDGAMGAKGEVWSGRTGPGPWVKLIIFSECSEINEDVALVQDATANVPKTAWKVI